MIEIIPGNLIEYATPKLSIHVHPLIAQAYFEALPVGADEQYGACPTVSPG